MVVDTPHGEFEVKDITRKERRKYYKKVKKGDNAFIFIIGQFNIWKSKGANNEL